MPFWEKFCTQSRKKSRILQSFNQHYPGEAISGLTIFQLHLPKEFLVIYCHIQYFSGNFYGGGGVPKTWS